MDLDRKKKTTGSIHQKVEVVALASTPGGYWTPITILSEPIPVAQKGLDQVTKNLLEDLDVPVFSRAG